MAEKTLSERYWDLKEFVDSLEERVRVLEAVIRVEPESVLDVPERRRGNPNWVKK